jgi:hypothetical protein
VHGSLSPMCSPPQFLPSVFFFSKILLLVEVFVNAKQIWLCRNEYPLFDNFDFRELSSMFKDTEEDWAVWFDRIGVSDGDSDEDLPLQDDATLVEQIYLSLHYQILY